MPAEFDKPNILQRILPMFRGFDPILLLLIGWLASIGLMAMYSAGYDHGTRFEDHGRNMLLAVGILFVVAQIPPQKLMAIAVPLYAVGVALLIAVLLFGITRKGAQRWVNVGVVIQPSEILKIAAPLMLAEPVQALMNINGDMINEVAVSNNIHMIRSLIKEKMGIGILCWLDIIDEVESDELQFIPLTDPQLKTFTLSLCVAPTRQLSLAASMMLKQLEMLFSEIQMPRGERD